MEDTTMVEEEDSKQFDSVNGGNEEDNQPDPDEPLMMDAGNGRVWLVKVRIYPPPTASPLPTTSPPCRFPDTSWSVGPPSTRRVSLSPPSASTHTQSHNQARSRG